MRMKPGQQVGSGAAQQRDNQVVGRADADGAHAGGELLGHDGRGDRRVHGIQHQAEQLHCQNRTEGRAQRRHQRVEEHQVAGGEEDQLRLAADAIGQDAEQRLDQHEHDQRDGVGT
ncbi:hypothetical protein G6F31_018854 [Rhizopus arrhizus]|nr:hypothetical protein G6F31_018854 [Rhizopus arrhizus]